MKKVVLLVLFAILLLVSCSQDIKPSDEINVSNTFGASLKAGKTITVNGTYRPDYFSSDSSVFNKNLAMLSFVGATSMNKQACKAFYRTIGFSHRIAYGWDQEPTSDSVGFIFAYKKIDNSEIVAVTVRGFNYDSEWSNNLTIGQTGNHQGFSLESEKILTALQSYISIFVSNPDEMKIWIMGYSRGGGISDMLAYRLLSLDYIEEENLYTYTFEAPSSLCNEYSYDCVHDVRNSGDLIPYIPPAQWGLYRAGVETDIYSDNIRSYLIEDLGFAEEDFPQFDSTDYSTPSIFISDYLISGLMTIPMLSTRSNYVDNVQTPISEFAVILMADKKKGMSVLKDYFSGLSLTQILQFISGCYTDPEYAYNTFKPVLEDAGVSFTDQQLEDTSAFINAFINAKNAFEFISKIYNNYSGNAKYIIYSHYPEVTYVALKHYQPN